MFAGKSYTHPNQCVQSLVKAVLIVSIRTHFQMNFVCLHVMLKCCACKWTYCLIEGYLIEITPTFTGRVDRKCTFRFENIQTLSFSKHDVYITWFQLETLGWIALRFSWHLLMTSHYAVHASTLGSHKREMMKLRLQNKTAAKLSKRH